MRALIIAATLATTLTIMPVMAQTPPASASHAAYSTADTDIGTLLDDPTLKAIVDNHIPGLLSGDQISMARSMTLKAIQQYAPDKVTDDALAAIDADFSKLPAKK
jgi:hypothetical protein